MTEKIDRSDKKPLRPIGVALQKAVSDFKGLATLFLAFGGVIAAYVGLQHGIALPQPWPVIGSLVPILIFGFFYLAPEWRQAITQKHLRDLGIHGQLKDPGFFRLAPYRKREKDKYVRPDGADETVQNWIIENSSESILYLYGQSGVGKSSLLNAGVIPRLEQSDPEWIVVNVRLHDRPLANILAVLSLPSVVWQNPPKFQPETAAVAVEKAERYAREQKKNLLLVFDQFEEVLILLDEKERLPFVEFLRGLLAEPSANLVVLISLRAEYLSDLVSLQLPTPTIGGNCCEVRPFTQAAARNFLDRSELTIGPVLLKEVLSEAAEIEDMPDRVRPIVLNMMGLVLASFQGVLPKGVTPGRLLSGYVHRAVNAGDIRSCARDILKPLLTDAGTKRGLSLDNIARQSKVPPHIARGCLIRLADSGIVRPVDDDSDWWEVAHDFVARLLQPIVQNWRKSTWDVLRPWIAPSALVIWIGAIALFVFALPEIKDAIAIRELSRVGLVPVPSKPELHDYRYNGANIGENEFARGVSYFPWLKEPVTGLNLSGATRTVKSLVGWPQLNSLRELTLEADELNGLQGFPPQPSLRSLKLVSKKLFTLSGMPEFVVLNELKLNTPALENISGMTSLAQLESLELNVENFRFTGARTLPALKSISVSSKRVGFSGMPSFPNLETLEFSGGGEAALSDMPVQPKLQTLRLLSAPIRQYNLPGWARLRSVEAIIENQVDVDKLATLGSTIADMDLTFLKRDRLIPRLFQSDASDDRNSLNFSSFKKFKNTKVITLRGSFPELNFILLLESLQKLVFDFSYNYERRKRSPGFDDYYSYYAASNDLSLLATHNNHDLQIVFVGPEILFSRFKVPDSLKGKLLRLDE